MNVRSVVADDEPHAREGIKIRLKKFPKVKVVGECSSGREAVEMINSLRPDLVFLDIQMPDLNGFEVLQEMDVDPMPVVIFVTAYDKYAVKAFECHALDYLLKPISEERFKESMQLAISQIGRDRLEAYADRLELLVRDYIKISQRNLPAPEIRPSVTSGDFLVWLTVRSRGQISMIPVQEVDWIESAGDYVYIHSNSKKLLTRETLIFLEKRMDPRRFVRIHRSAIVNLERVSSLKPNDHGDCEVVLQNGDRLRLSRSYRKHFQKAIGNSI